jgi:hypothetical protein
MAYRKDRSPSAADIVRTTNKRPFLKAHTNTLVVSTLRSPANFDTSSAGGINFCTFVRGQPVSLSMALPEFILEP